MDYFKINYIYLFCYTWVIIIKYTLNSTASKLQPLAFNLLAQSISSIKTAQSGIINKIMKHE